MPLDPAGFAAVVEIYQTEIDSLIENMGKNVIVHMPVYVSNVSDEFYDPVTGDIKMPDYKTESTDLSPSSSGVTVQIKALLKYNPREFETFGIKVNEPRGILRLKTYLTDVPNLQRCEFVVPNQNSQDVINSKYRLVRHPVPVGLQQDRYAITYWERI